MSMPVSGVAIWRELARLRVMARRSAGISDFGACNIHPGFWVG